MENLLYKRIQTDIKSQIIAGIYREGDLLPSENDFCQLYSVTRSTIRQSLNALVSEGYIDKRKGKGSVVLQQTRRTLGLLTVKGFSEVVGDNKQPVNTVIIDKPALSAWEENFFYHINEWEKKAGCISLKRLRCVGDDPVMLETTYLSNMNLPGFCKRPFINGSLFETLNRQYHVEITKVEQDLRAVLANNEDAGFLKVEVGAPLLHIYLKFYTSREHLFIYSSLLCNTGKYSIGNKL